MSTAALGTDLDRLEQISRPKIAVFNPTDVDDNVMVAGHPYHFPPGGTVLVSDQHKHPWTKDTTGRWRADTSKREVSISAKDIALHIVSDINRGPKGYVILFGDGQDEDRKQAATEKYITWRMDHALSVERAWVAQCAAYGAGNPGAIPPRPSKSVRAELVWLDKNRKGYVGRKRFICILDSLDWDDQGEATAHAQLSHPGLDAAKVVIDTAAALQPRPAEAIQAETSGSESAPAPRARGGGPVVDSFGRTDDETLDTAVLLDEAEGLGVNLTRAELAGLLKQDQAVIGAVTSKLAGVKAKRAEKR